ncbi:hypothetical protein FDI24_gp234 [Acidovorax phage ACP17]|uniref:Uncharacterized protein n=1 Tax=Acidovorax phage ACP17 TaxID=2010329 RepID=A0A218M395_9CAUD|nr:hypothetical protein FDI24_gp234 [Acidovorax phage ACP17]ASD50515.1 hypothetical protein [Acidovorax phage ACP17]
MSNILLVGSAALEFHKIKTGRPRQDLDFICSAAAFSDAVRRYRMDPETRGVVKSIMPTLAGQAVIWRDGTIWDAEFFEGGTDPAKESEWTFHRGVVSATGHVAHLPGIGEVSVPDIDFLYMLKMSHRFKKNSKFFRKTMDDILLLRSYGADIAPADQSLYEARQKCTYTYGHPKLNVDKKSFFKDDVPYLYDHDTIHEAVAIMSRPAYTHYMVDGEQVLTSRTKFEALPLEVRLLGVLEESYVLALERSIIPHASSPRKAFMMALEKVCTSITSGWFREFAWENYHTVVAMYDHYGGETFVEKFKLALAAGRIAPFRGSIYDNEPKPQQSNHSNPSGEVHALVEA